MPRVGEMPQLFGNASRRTVLGGIVGATGAVTLGAASLASGMSKGAVAPSPEFFACRDLWATLVATRDDDAADVALEEYLTAFDRFAALQPSTGKLFELNQLARVEVKGPVQRKHLRDFDYITIALYQCLDASQGRRFDGGFAQQKDVGRACQYPLA